MTAGERAHSPSSWTRGGPHGHHERSLHAVATCTIRDVTIRSPVVGNQPFRVYPWPSICRGANVNPAALERHVDCYYSGVRADGSANKTTCARWCRGVPPSVVKYRGTLVGMYGPNHCYRIYIRLYTIGIAHQRYCKRIIRKISLCVSTCNFHMHSHAHSIIVSWFRWSLKCIYAQKVYDRKDKKGNDTLDADFVMENSSYCWSWILAIYRYKLQDVILLLTLTYILWEVTCMLNHIRKLSTLFVAASLLNVDERCGVKLTLTSYYKLY